MTSWSYEPFEAQSSGREAITELEKRVLKKLEALGPRAICAKVAMTNVIKGTARAVIFYPKGVIPMVPAKNIASWKEADTNTIADSADTERYKEEMYQGIVEILNALPDEQTVWSKITTTDYKDGFATTTIWYPSEVS
ncbi:MAG: hypothetical protein D3923_10850 [Candidatus Electrothrix sp. AR3]|nr:hypothetical protein [Candidatus Electrothrix sp. AR3]